MTHYLREKLPPYYIGSSSYKRVLVGYHGTVVSKKYKELWWSEIADHPSFFETEVLSFHSTREEALAQELIMQKEFDVVKNPLFINMGLASINGFFGRDVSGKNNPRYHQGYLTAGEKNGMYGVHRHGDLKLWRKGKEHHCYGRTGKKHPMFGKHGADNPNTGKMWVTNGPDRKFVTKDIARELFDQGYYPGSKHDARKKRATTPSNQVVTCPHCAKVGDGLECNVGTLTGVELYAKFSPDHGDSFSHVTAPYLKSLR